MYCILQRTFTFTSTVDTFEQRIKLKEFSFCYTNKDFEVVKNIPCRCNIIHHIQTSSLIYSQNILSKLNNETVTFEAQMHALVPTSYIIANDLIPSSVYKKTQLTQILPSIGCSSDGFPGLFPSDPIQPSSEPLTPPTHFRIVIDSSQTCTRPSLLSQVHLRGKVTSSWIFTRGRPNAGPGPLAAPPSAVRPAADRARAAPHQTHTFNTPRSQKCSKQSLLLDRALLHRFVQ